MSYAIVGFGAVGQALARMFARKGIEVVVASRHQPAALAPQANAIGLATVPKTLKDALEADIVMLAVPYGQHREVAKARATWKGKIVIDATNTLEDLGGVPSSSVIAQTLPGAQLVKAFNHLPARVLTEDPAINGGRSAPDCRARNYFFFEKMKQKLFLITPPPRTLSVSLPRRSPSTSPTRVCAMGRSAQPAELAHPYVWSCPR
jgi:NADP oxidoreductase coenzyme F420-dependent